MAHLVLAVTLLIWSFSFLAAARLRQDLGLVDAMAARFLPVLLGAGLLLLWRRPLRLPRAAWWRIAALGLLGVPVYNLAFLHGLKTVPTGTAALIIALNPVFTAVLARIVLKEGFGRRRTAGLGLALPECSWSSARPDKPVDWPYLSSAFVRSLAPLSWAVYTVIGRRLPAAAGALDALTRSSSLAASRSSPSPLPRSAEASSRIPAPCGCPVSGRSVHARRLRRLDLGPEAPARGEVAAFVFLNPPLANLWAWLFEGATLKPPFLLGALVLLAGVAAIVAPLPRLGAVRASESPA